MARTKEMKVRSPNRLCAQPPPIWGDRGSVVHLGEPDPAGEAVQVVGWDDNVVQELPGEPSASPVLELEDLLHGHLPRNTEYEY